MSEKQPELSKCHKAPVRVVSGDDSDIGNTEGVTNHYECTECGQACDLYVKPKPKKPAKPARDYEGLKQKFIVQPHYKDARTYLRKEHGFTEQELKNGNVRRKIEGWGKERVKKRATLAEEAYAELRNTEKERLADLLKGKLNLMKIIIDRIDNEGELDDAEARELKTLWEIVKTELGEPTSITRTGIYADRGALDEAEKELKDITNGDRNDTAGNPSSTAEISKAL